MTASDSPTPKKERQKEQALAALLCSPTIAAAAKQASLSEATLLRWLKTDEIFKADYQAARREVVSLAVTGLQRAAGGAVAVLVEVAEDDSAPASSRVSAARTILDYSLRAVELEDLQARVEALEEVLKANGN